MEKVLGFKEEKKKMPTKDTSLVNLNTRGLHILSLKEGLLGISSK